MIKSRRMRWAGHVARMGEKRNPYRILVGKPKEKRPLGRPRLTWVDSIKMDRRDIGWDCVDWTDMARDTDQWRALMNTVLNLGVHKMLEVLEWLHNWRLLKKGSAA
jgi:transcription termination factor 2